VRLRDEVSLKLGQRPEHVENELATAGGGVDLLLQRSDGVNEMTQAPAEPVQPPDDERVLAVA
jgi:hypothetical protein